MINIFWFRRDLRLDDNTALHQAVLSGLPVLPVFIFDTNITDGLPADDPRITFIYETLSVINTKLAEYDSSVLVLKGDPESIWKELLGKFEINTAFINKDYEPYAIQRDNSIEALLHKHGILFSKFKDQVIFEEDHIYRAYPFEDKTTYRGPHLRFCTMSIRTKVNIALQENQVFLNELIWREFFMQILFHFPHVVTGNFRPVYENLQWRNNENEFEGGAGARQVFRLLMQV
jgi:deoxyribodipyrimidine photo-lyase